MIDDHVHRKRSLSGGEVLNISVNSRKGDLWYQLNSDPVPRKGKNQYGGWDARLFVYRFFYRMHSRLVEYIRTLYNCRMNQTCRH